MYATTGPNASLWLLEIALALTGAGLAFNTGPAVGLAMAAVAVHRAGLTSGVVNLARLVGITVGVAALGTVLAAIGGGAMSGVAFSDGVRAAVLLGGLIEFIGAAVTFRYVRRAQRPDPVPATAKEVSHA
jgi:hypothetical protein